MLRGEGLLGRFVIAMSARPRTLEGVPRSPRRRLVAALASISVPGRLVVAEPPPPAPPGTRTRTRRLWLLLSLAVLTAVALYLVSSSATGNRSVSAPPSGALAFDTGNTIWLFFTSALVFMMTPGMALLFGG